MKKQKVLRKLKKVQMLEPSTVKSAPTRLTPVTVPKPQYRSFIGRILQSITAALLNPPKSNLARVAVAFDTHKATIAAPADEKKTNIYASYVAFCKVISGGVHPDTKEPLEILTPRSIEDWDEQRDKQKPKHGKHPHYRITKDKGNRFSRCLHCATEFTDGKGKTTQSVFAFCEETPITQGMCKRAWLEFRQPACLRGVERPVTFDKHIARSVSSYRLFRKNGTPRNVERRISVDLATMQVTPEWVESFVVKVDALKPSTKERKLPYKSKWCRGCEEYVEQSHSCQRHDAHLQHWQYYKTTSALLKTHQLLIADSVNLFAHMLEDMRRVMRLMKRMRRRVTSVADRIVVVSQSELDAMLPLNAWLPPSKSYVGDYLAKVNPRTCKHINLRSFTFSTGETIQSCPDCTAFDEERQDVLKTVNISALKGTQLREWDNKLKTEGLSEGRAAFHPSLCWGDFDDLADFDDVGGEASFNSGARVNTAGCVGTDGDGVHKDSSVRDRRANAIRREEAKHVPLTNSLCWWCGAELWDRKGTHFCPDTDHRQRFDEEVDELIRALQKLPTVKEKATT